jgi:hypothetical protein
LRRWFILVASKFVWIFGIHFSTSGIRYGFLRNFASKIISLQKINCFEEVFITEEEIIG